MKLRTLTLLCLMLLPGMVMANELSFGQAWTKLQQVSDKLKANAAEVSRAQALQRGGEDLGLPSLNLTGNYTHLDNPVEMDLRDLNPLASLDLSAIAAVAQKSPILGAVLPQLGGMLQSLPMTTALTEQDIFRASLQALWPIYTGGKITAAQRIQQAQVAEKKQSAELGRRALFTTLVDRYYGVIVAKQAWRTQQQLVDALKEHVNHAIKLEQQGQIAKVERLNAEVALANAKVGAGHAMRQYQMAQIALNRMLHSHNAEPDTGLFMLAQDPSLPSLTELTMAQHPALRLLEAKEEQAKGLESLERSDYLPTVFMYGNYTLYEDDSIAAKMSPDWLVGVGIKVPLIANNGRSDKVEAAKSALLQARYTKAQTRQDLNLLLDQSYRQLQQAREEVSSLNTTLALARENLRLRELAFNQGMSTSVERVDAQVKLTAVETRQLAATYQYVQAYARLMAVSGQLDEFVARSGMDTAIHSLSMHGENDNAR